MAEKHLLPPAAPGRWLLGNLPEFRRDMLGFFTRTARDYGDVVRMRFGPRLVHLISHPDFVEQILVSEHRVIAARFRKRVAQQRRRILASPTPLDSAGIQPQQRE
jgi:hypothetical protein